MPVIACLGVNFSALIQPQLFVVAYHDKDPTQNEKKHDLNRSGRRASFKHSEMEFSSISTQEPGGIDPENIPDELVTPRDFLLDVKPGIPLHPYPNNCKYINKGARSSGHYLLLCGLF